MRKSKSGSRFFVVGVIFIILVVVAVIIGYRTAKQCEYEYRLAAHPKNYSEFVSKYALEYEMDEDLIYAVIKTESDFDCEAVSDVGARGLMQIMEETFDWIKYRLGDDESVYDDMFDPEMNIRYGAYLMDYLLEKFGDKDTAVAAYHSGAGCVSSWLEEKENSADGKRLDNIPSSTAQHYVNKINNALSNYKELYNNERN
ncbi:MAG: lytic transglycosylase domain-containing protein [Ruminiclostridium sp.]|nr:lytic transglycosylase domain-containing protein [Ruminiclostridium sp.]